MAAIQGQFRAFLRLQIFLIYLLVFLTSAHVVYFTARDPITRKRRMSRHGRWWCGLACRTFGIEVRVKNKPSDDVVGLVVGNHMGFIDIIAVASIMPNLFVTSREMRETPVLGMLTEMGGCIYVERRSRTNILKELGEMIDYLKNGFRVTLYPEATSHNGEEILPFKRTLLTAAAHAGVPVVPYCFNFLEINGEPFSLKHRDHVCYWGTIPFHISLWRMGTLKKIVCEVEYLPEVRTSVDDDRGEVADRIRQMIVDKFIPVADS